MTLPETVNPPHVPAEDAELDPFDARVAHGATGLLAAFNRAGVLVAADVHVATRLGALLGEGAEEILLAAALAVRAPRLGHVYVDLAEIAESATVESEAPVDLAALPWPDPAAWLPAVAASPLVAATPCPLRLEGSRLYLDRYRQEELHLAADLRAFVAAPAEPVDEPALLAGLARLFGGEQATGAQATATATAVRGRLTVVAGGPGTGKTTTVTRIAALLHEQAAALGSPAPLIALAAPTGKAAARLEEAVHEQAGGLDVESTTTETLLALRATTLHRLLGWRPDSHARFRHHRGNRLPHDVVIVDESSMVSLSLMARLVEAVRPDARLVLVGDPDQLTSVEAGAVLGDLVAPGALPGVVVLDRPYRYADHGAIDTLAQAICAGDPDAVLAALQTNDTSVQWLSVDVASAGESTLAPIRAAAVEAGRKVLEHARAGEALEALDALGSFRVLCAHRRGPYGAGHWMVAIERWLADALPGFDPRRRWYVGRPLLVTENDHGLELYNGDTGVVVTTGPGEVRAAFERRGAPVAFSPTRLQAIDTVYAMTVHKGQGSQFATAAVLLPAADSPLLTRELLYTAVTRASGRLILAGTEAAIRRAVLRPAARASGLREELGVDPDSARRR